MTAGRAQALTVLVVLLGYFPAGAGQRSDRLASWASEVRRVVAPGAIPAIDLPNVIPVGQAHLSPQEPVVGVTVAGESRAYSLWLLNSHEVVNDVVGGRPVAVVWCPLANLAVVYSRRDGEELRHFEASGSLLKNTVVLRDRETGSLWNALTGEAIEGPLTGRRLRDAAAARRATWTAWSAANPRGTVATSQGSASPRYDSYADYHKSFLRTGIHRVANKDRRLPVKSSVIGIFGASRGRALPLSLFSARKTLRTSIEDRSVLVYVAGGGAQVVAYDVAVEHGGQEFLLEFDDVPVRDFDHGGADLVPDRETGTVWDLGSGRAVAGPLAGARLEEVPHRLLYWFVWADYFPQTRVRVRR